MNWITPKTDWTGEDYFEIDDYNRIRNNLLYLKDLAEQLYPFFLFSDMGKEKTYSDDYFANDFNQIEMNLAKLIGNTYPIPNAVFEEWETDGVFIDAINLNRIETMLLDIYTVLKSQKDGVNKLQFVCGGSIWK